MSLVSRVALKIIANGLFVTLFLFAPSSSFAENVIIHVKQTRNTLDIQAVFAGETRKYTIAEQDAIVQKLEKIYNLLGGRQLDDRHQEEGTLDKVSRFVDGQLKTIKGLIPKWKDEPEKKSVENADPTNDEIKSLLSEAGHSLYQPIESFIETASAVEFVVTEDCLPYPLDALFYQGTPLFLHKPVIYCFTRQKDMPLLVSKDWQGFMISDPGNDPEKGVLLVKGLFPNSRYFDGQDVRQEDLLQMERADFVLVSAKGGVEGLILPKIAIRSMSFSHMQPKLVYLDACQLGLRLDFLHSFRQAGALYYIAPILSNEVGDTSKKTMERFFRALHNGETPSYALFLTRKTLYDLYTYQDDEFSKVMWRAFPFRLYRLN